MCTHGTCEKPDYAKELCISHYRQMLRRKRGLKKPGPKPNPTAPNSRHNPQSRRAATEVVVPVRRADIAPQATATHCAHGHEWTLENTAWRKREGYADTRVCRACQVEATRRYRAKRREKRGPSTREPGRPPGTHCKRGHAFTEENSLERADGGRSCRACQKHRNLVKSYGITLDEFESMLSAQEGVCAICKGELDMGRHTHLDHCHDSGRVRGVLCHRCNLLLGNALDDPALLLRAAEYLEGDSSCSLTGTAAQATA